MPSIKIQKRINDDEDSSMWATPMMMRGRSKKPTDIKNMKIMSEAEKYLKDPNSEIFYWRKIKSTRVGPEVREQFIISRVDQRIYIFGGLSHDCLGDFLTCDTHKWRWEKIDTINDDWFIEPRLAHSVDVYNEHLIIYGGLKKFRGGFKVGDVFQGFFMYNTITGKWKRPLKANNNMLPWRRNHLSFILGTDFLVYGGQDENGKIHKTWLRLSLEDFEWKENIETVDQTPKQPFMFHRKNRKVKENKNNLKYKIEHLKESSLIVDGSPGRVTHHSGWLVIHKSSKGHNHPFTIYERDLTRVPPPGIVQYEGLYVFGGKDKEGEVKGNLYILNLGKYPCNWINCQKYIDNESPSPSARYGHSMHFSPELNFVVLFGGRNDSFGDTSKWVFNDIWILKLDILNWVKVQVHGDIPQKRYSFGSCLNGTQLIVFGGLNGKTYNSAGLFVWEMDHLKALKHVLTNGKKKAYFEEFPIEKSLVSKKTKKEQSVLDLINNKPKIRLTKIERLQKQLQEGIAKKNMSGYQQ